MSEQFPPSWLERVFDRAAREEIFDGHAPDPYEPVLVLLGGQPAAGKTHAQNSVIFQHPEDDLVPVTGDDLRRFHPKYNQLVIDAPLEMPGETAPVSGGLIKLALQHALQHRYSVLLEGTFRDRDMVTATATQFASAGYRVEAAAVAVPAPVSRLRAEQRFLLAPHPLAARWTPPDAHETALRSAADVVQALEASAHVVRVQVYGQFGVLYDHAQGDDSQRDRQSGASQILREEQARPLSPQEAVDWLRRYQVTFTAADARPDYLALPNVRAGYRQLQADARQILAAIASSAGARTLAREHIERERTLRRAMAPAERLREMIRGSRSRGLSQRKPYPLAIDDDRPSPEPPSISR